MFLLLSVRLKGLFVVYLLLCCCFFGSVISSGLFKL